MEPRKSPQSVQTDSNDRLHSAYYPIDAEIPVPTRYGLMLRLVSQWTRGRHLRVLEIGPERPAIATAVVQGLGIDARDYESVDSSEISAEALRDAGFHPRILDVSRDDLPFPTASFDVVIASEVIEHLTRPEWFLRNCRRALRGDGILVMTTPNLAAWFNRYALAVGRQPIYTETGEEWVFGRDPFAPTSRPVGHLHVLTLRAFRQLVRHAGFDVLELVGVRNDEIQRRGGVLSLIDRAAARFPELAADLVLVARATVSK